MPVAKPAPKLAKAAVAPAPAAPAPKAKLAVAKATPAPVKAPKAETEEKGPRVSRIAGELEGKKLVVLVAENPKREGTASHARFALYKNGMTYAEALEAGVKNADIHWDMAHEFISFK